MFIRYLLSVRPRPGSTRLPWELLVDGDRERCRVCKNVRDEAPDTCVGSGCATYRASDPGGGNAFCLKHFLFRRTKSDMELINLQSSSFPDLPRQGCTCLSSSLRFRVQRVINSSIAIQLTYRTRRPLKVLSSLVLSTFRAVRPSPRST